MGGNEVTEECIFTRVLKIMYICVFALICIKRCEKIHLKTEIFSQKVLLVQKKAVPLHPLSKRGE